MITRTYIVVDRQETREGTTSVGRVTLQEDLANPAPVPALVQQVGLARLSPEETALYPVGTRVVGTFTVEVL
jgi:hypothetical protein